MISHVSSGGQEYQADCLYSILVWFTAYPIAFNNANTMLGSIADMAPSTPTVTMYTRTTVRLYGCRCPELEILTELDEYFDALGKAYREEFKELYDLGCSTCNPTNLLPSLICALGNIQIDDPLLCYVRCISLLYLRFVYQKEQGCDEGIRQRTLAEGIDPVEELKVYVRAINVCTQDRPTDLTISLHMCRGNWPSGAGVCLSCKEFGFLIILTTNRAI